MLPDSSNQPSLFADFLSVQPLLDAIDKLGYRHPLPVQLQSVPAALEGKDLLVSAATGSGKTLAFLLPTMQRLLTKPLPKARAGIRALILAPTRELASQIAELSQKLNEFTGIKTVLISGGDGFKQQQALFKDNIGIIVATPGRLLEHLQQQALVLKQLEILVLDEADRMLDMGFRDNVLQIVEYCGKQRQTLLFSATLMKHGVIKLADLVLKDYKIIALNARNEGHNRIEQQVVLADDNDHKQKLLLWLLEHKSYDKALVFTNTRIRADNLQGPLRGHKLRAAVLHGEMEPKERPRIMSLYRDGVINILISTDLAARGLDVTGVNLIINFDMPRNGIDYIHRIGRTGRADHPGLAISLVKNTEWNLMSSIERFLQQPFKRLNIAELAGHYQGPKKLKSSGKAAGVKKKAEKKAPAEKIKIRDRDKKNIGKRRKPSDASSSDR